MKSPACCKIGGAVAKLATRFETERGVEKQTVADFVTKKMVLQNFLTTSEFRRILPEKLWENADEKRAKTPSVV